MYLYWHLRSYIFTYIYIDIAYILTVCKVPIAILTSRIHYHNMKITHTFKLPLLKWTERQLCICILDTRPRSISFQIVPMCALFIFIYLFNIVFHSVFNFTSFNKTYFSRSGCDVILFYFEFFSKTIRFIGMVRWTHFKNSKRGFSFYKVCVVVSEHPGLWNIS